MAPKANATRAGSGILGPARWALLTQAVILLATRDLARYGHEGRWGVLMSPPMTESRVRDEWWSRLNPRRRRSVALIGVLGAFVVLWETYKLVWGAFGRENPVRPRRRHAPRIVCKRRGWAEMGHPILSLVAWCREESQEDRDGQHRACCLGSDVVDR